MGQSRMDNPETMHATLGTQDTGQRQTKQNTQNIESIIILFSSFIYLSVQ